MFHACIERFDVTENLENLDFRADETIEYYLPTR